MDGPLFIGTLSGSEIDVSGLDSESISPTDTFNCWSDAATSASTSVTLSTAASFITTFIDSIMVLVLELNTLYALLFGE
ncbi:hypothetical protein A2U01_0067698 [Trifolium medium]|uniref:Uncharacterized protein n=1 Tax=Trifolium medium TaxID=97028 RepID=A0A392SC72_9FABA|nr:hypothetical protein [Trifolium medium]